MPKTQLSPDLWPTMLEMGECSFYHFLIHIQKAKPTWQQMEFVVAVDSGELSISVRSGRGPGKSFIVGNFVV